MPADERPPTAGALNDWREVLAAGEVTLQGRMPWSSNATFLAEVRHGGRAVAGVYKPWRGERPLWDFPGGLYRREVAAHLLSEALGWGLVPETVVRHDAPLGVGSLQRFVPADFEEHYFTLLEHPEHHDGLRRIAAFDLVANNADRKAGHCLLGQDGRLWAIDNALSFHAAPKLRTVIWDFAGEALAPALVADIERVAAAGVPGIDELLAPAEVAALGRRAAGVARVARFPEPDPSARAYPWPLV